MIEQTGVLCTIYIQQVIEIQAGCGQLAEKNQHNCVIFASSFEEKIKISIIVIELIINSCSTHLTLILINGIL